MSGRIDLDGKVAVVTGAANGIGRAVARSLAKRGCNVAIADLNEEGLEEKLRPLHWYRTQAWNADVLFGKVNPGGKLPVSFPRSVGELPVFYNRHPSADGVQYLEGQRRRCFRSGMA